ncbi:MAG: 3-hydroxyacyl-CoA dehydrogenase NAD-binding domain-containing protein [Crocinitomicaceae bacterium]|jgi:3-hydroxybutyryl-CoA dehydrogenase|nr:3-hydroxyacyl-CoA dehydrogenase NAD-binding domain-containing protein [Crocinitomicaceae bacterium]MDP4739070.1 3-hydroxyacyl-CoA dehydrogenase NAD-binding domain-containing protein [Crocinitomicaceae bacterium]MDP4799752.1 3-hydroxyacyl-CoA dehydrogenase NAD-binding domain-containing protein [Crocinitomicaceae bacterium]MDP4868521.1 3-hydroxyacyl-CoA dehydrogenase NAD-binding domain-containing protein [Crocinitomicaceae bacterium]MDP4954518.1 3-hydroxyacyl-CoA dehydrogenase NAD-binding doma
MKEIIGVIGAGTMGAGIAQVAAQAGHKVVLSDTNPEQLLRAEQQIKKSIEKLVEKGKFTAESGQEILQNLQFSTQLSEHSQASLVIEAIIENLGVKHQVFQQLEQVVGPTCVLASNTSSLSIASIGACLQDASRFMGIHFFNPATLMPLVEVIPGVATSVENTERIEHLITSWNKTVVVCKDTPGFIVNRVARPFYGEALRIYEEGLADFATIDWAMTTIGGFKMGPFTLMDYIGNDINYTVTETVFAAFYYDPRFKPSFTQKRHMEAGFLGRKSGRGFYDYKEGSTAPAPIEDQVLGSQIFERILVLLINEAADAVFMQVASPAAVDLAMTKGVNYPKGLLAWADELGTAWVLERLESLFAEYGEDRYRPNPLLRRKAREQSKFIL